MTEPDLPSSAYSDQSDLSLFEVLVLALFIVGGGLLFGALAYWLFSDMWMIVLCPLIVGCLAGYPYAWTIRLFRIRSTIHVVLAALLTAVMIYFTNFYLQYLEISKLLVIEELSFWRFMSLIASEGLAIGEYGGTGIPVSGLFVWLLWLVEIGITGAVIAVLGREAATKPFCEACQDWYNKEVLLGGVAPEQIADFDQAIEQTDYQQANSLIQPEYSEPERLDVYLSRCKQSAHKLLLRVDRVERKHKGSRTSELWRRSIAPNDAHFFKPNEKQGEIDRA